MDDLSQFVDDYMPCTQLRDQSSRLIKLPYGNANVAETGHPQKTGAIDRSTLCTFRPKDKVCVAPPASDTSARTGDRTASQRAVRQQTVQQQLNGSFRSVERKIERYARENERMRQAKCTSLLQGSL